MKEKTAIDWLIDVMNNDGLLRNLNEIQLIQMDDLFEKAKAKFKEQIEEGYWAGLDGLMNDYSECETFGDRNTKTGGGAAFYYQQKYGDETENSN